MAYGTKATMTHKPGCVDLRFPYHPGVIDMLKSEIPGRFRRYDPQTKTWTVFSPHVSRARTILETYFPGNVEEVRPQATAAETAQDEEMKKRQRAANAKAAERMRAAEAKRAREAAAKAEAKRAEQEAEQERRRKASEEARAKGQAGQDPWNQRRSGRQEPFGDDFWEFLFGKGGQRQSNFGGTNSTGFGALDDYLTLGVQRSATPQEIKKAYLALSRKHHPDLGGDAEQMKRINAAYGRIGPK